MASGKGHMFNFIAKDEALMRKVKIVLAYESGVRGQTIGRTLSDMIEAAVDSGKYPKAVKDQLREIDREVEARAIDRACKAVKLPSRS